MLAQFPDIRTYRICDLGGSRHFWEKVGLGIPPNKITVYNISNNEINTTSGGKYEDIDVLIYNGKKIPVQDGEFDLLICNSVIEHVPPKDRVAFAGEMKRVAMRVFCQTPAYEFPIEPHFVMPFLHWLPRSIGFQLAKVSPWRLLSKPSIETIKRYFWDTQLLTKEDVREIFPEYNRLTEKVLGLDKSYYIIIEQPETLKMKG